MKTKTNVMVVTALLSAIAIIIPLFVPIKVVIFPFSATFASHVPLILAMFLGPLPAAFAAIVSALGFLSSLGPVVSARASVHVIFLLFGAFLLKKRVNVYIVAFTSMILHAISEMLIVYVLFMLGTNLVPAGKTMSYVLWVIALGTSIHHLFDFSLSMLIYIPLSKQFPNIFVPVFWGKKKTAE